MASLIEEFVVQAYGSRIVSFVHKSVGVHDCVIGFDPLRAELQSW